jgi:hypothetical protein
MSCPDEGKFIEEVGFLFQKKLFIRARWRGIVRSRVFMMAGKCSSLCTFQSSLAETHCSGGWHMI